MTARIMHFDSPQALENISKIILFLEKHGQASTVELADVICLSGNHVGAYLRLMAKEGMAHRVSRAQAFQGGKHPARWAPGPKDANADPVTDDMPRQVIVRKAWHSVIPAMFEPMAYLYGRAA